MIVLDSVLFDFFRNHYFFPLHLVVCSSVLKADNVNMLQEDLVNEHYFFVPPETVEEDGFTSLNLQVTVSTPLFPGNGQVRSL